MFPLLTLTKFRSSLISLTMPATRSRSKAAAARTDQQSVPEPPRSGRSRKVTPDEAAEPVVQNQAPPKKNPPGKRPASTVNTQPLAAPAVPSDPGPPPALVPAELSFAFEEAKQHLIKADTRFQDVFTTAVCTPYQKLDRVEPFR